MNQYETLMAQQQIWAAHHEALRQVVDIESALRAAGFRPSPLTRLRAALRQRHARPTRYVPQPSRLTQAHG